MYPYILYSSLYFLLLTKHPLLRLRLVFALFFCVRDNKRKLFAGQSRFLVFGFIFVKLALKLKIC
jgi:hypothetical protein